MGKGSVSLRYQLIVLAKYGDRRFMLYLANFCDTSLCWRPTSASKEKYRKNYILVYGRRLFILTTSYVSCKQMTIQMNWHIMSICMIYVKLLDQTPKTVPFVKYAVHVLTYMIETLSISIFASPLFPVL